MNVHSLQLVEILSEKKKVSEKKTVENKESSNCRNETLIIHEIQNRRNRID